MTTAEQRYYFRFRWLSVALILVSIALLLASHFEAARYSMMIGAMGVALWITYAGRLVIYPDKLIVQHPPWREIVVPWPSIREIRALETKPSLPGVLTTRFIEINFIENDQGRFITFPALLKNQCEFLAQLERRTGLKILTMTEARSRDK